MLRTTVGQVIVNSALPEELRDYTRKLDKKGLNDLLHDVATKHPDAYRDVSKKLADFGRHAASESGGYGISLEHLKKTKAGTDYSQRIQRRVDQILNDETLTPEKRNKLLISAAGTLQDEAVDAVYKEALAANNPAAMQILSGARGNKTNLSSLIGVGDSLYTDHRGNVMPLPVLHTYSQGLGPMEYWAGTYGARRGLMAVKFSTRDAGFLCLSKGTLVRMGDFSTKPIERVVVGDVVLGADKTGRTFHVKVTAAFKNGVKRLHRFRFRYGKSRTETIEVVATEDHKALVRHIRRRRERPRPKLVKYVTVGETRLGDCERRSVSFHSLIPPQGFDAPDYGVNEPWAWFLGLLIGDGGLTTNHIGLACGDTDFAWIIRSAMVQHGFVLNKKTGDNCEYTVVDSQKDGCRNRLRTFLSSVGLLGLESPAKFIPHEVDGWDNASVAAMIRGIFDTDGGVAWSNNDTMPTIRLGMTAPQVVYGVQRLLAQRFGVYGQVSVSRVAGTCRNGVNSWYDCFSLTIADRRSALRFAEQVGFWSPAKKDALESGLASMQRADREDDFAFHFLSKEAVGSGETFDIEVDHPDHLFVLANGAIVSNSKQMNQLAHRLMVVDEDDPRQGLAPRGLPVDTDDSDSEGSLLAHDVGGYQKNTVLTPKILKALKRGGHDRILVRSPAVGGSPDGGVYARDVGIRERGVLPGRGEQVGFAAAQALSEPISQGQLGAKHGGGIAGQDKIVGGFAAINQLIQTPSHFKGGATHATIDGTVSRIEPAPAGGQFLYVNDEKHYVPPGAELKVKRGDHIEAGDVMTSGWPNHATVSEHKGLGEGKRYFIYAMRDAMRESGMKVDRRNVELLARGLVNRVRMTDEYGDHVPDDVVPYSTLEHSYVPRDTSVRGRPAPNLVGSYLESPVLHYSIGTKVRPSVLKELQRFNIEEVVTHKDPPPFVPESVRGMSSLHHDPDWMTRMYGSGLKSSLLQAVHRGGTSDELGTSFVPGLARSVDFGRVGLVRQPEPGKVPPPEGQPFPDSIIPVKKPMSLTKPAEKPTWGSRLGSMLKLSEFCLKLAADLEPPKPPEPKTPSVGDVPLRRYSQSQMPPPVTGGVSQGDVPLRRYSQSQMPPPVTGGVSQGDVSRQVQTQPQQLTPQGQPQVTPGQVHPGRQANNPYYGMGQNPNAGGGRDYGMEGGGLAGQYDSPEAIAQFVEGGGFGGQVGQATRFGSVFNTAAISTLTGGGPYAQSNYSHQDMQDLPFQQQSAVSGGRGGGWGGQSIPQPNEPAEPAEPTKPPSKIMKWVGENPWTAGIGGAAGLGTLGVAWKGLQNKFPGFVSNRPEQMGAIGKTIGKVPLLRTLFGVSGPGTPAPGAPVPPAAPKLPPTGVQKIWNNPLTRSVGRFINNPVTRTVARGLGPASMLLGSVGVADSYLSGDAESAHQYGLEESKRLGEIITKPSWWLPLDLAGAVFNPVGNINSIVHTGIEAKRAFGELSKARQEGRMVNLKVLNDSENDVAKYEEYAETGRALTPAEQKHYEAAKAQVAKLRPIRDQEIARIKKQYPHSANLLVWSMYQSPGKLRREAAKRKQDELRQDADITRDFEQAETAFNVTHSTGNFGDSPAFKNVLEKYKDRLNLPSYRNGLYGDKDEAASLASIALTQQSRPWAKFLDYRAYKDKADQAKRLEEEAAEKAKGEAWKNYDPNRRDPLTGETTMERLRRERGPFGGFRPTPLPEPSPFEP